MTEIGTIKMRTPGGRQSWIAVHRLDDGSVDLHFGRTTEGEMLARLPIFAAVELQQLLAKATQPIGLGAPHERN